MKNGSPRGDDAAVGRVAGEIDSLRSELGGLVAELDRRRHEALDLGLQVRRHPVLVAAAVTAAALLLGSAIALAVRGSRQRRRPVTRARETRRALARLFSRPERIAAEPSFMVKLGTAVGVAAASALTRRIVERSVAPAPHR